MLLSHKSFDIRSVGWPRGLPPILSWLYQGFSTAYPRRTVSAHEALVDSLRDRILGGEFVPGAPLSDVELAAAYGVARPTLRAAVQTLVHEGLMRREPRRRIGPAAD